MFWFYTFIFIIKNIIICRSIFLNNQNRNKKVWVLIAAFLSLSQFIGTILTIFIYNVFISDALCCFDVNGALNASLFDDSPVALSGFVITLVFVFLGKFFFLRKRADISVSKFIILLILSAPYLLLLPMVRMCEGIVGLSVLIGVLFIMPYYLDCFFTNRIYLNRKKSNSETIDYRFPVVADALISEIVGIIAIVLTLIFFNFQTDSFIYNMLYSFSYGYGERHIYIIPIIGFMFAVVCNFIILTFIEFKAYKKEYKHYFTDVILLSIFNSPYVFFIPIINIIAVFINAVTFT